MKKLVCVLLALCLLVGASSALAEGDKVLTLGWSWAHKNDSLFNGMFDTVNAVLESTIAEHGYTSIEWIEVIAEDNAQTQSDDIEDLITRGVDAILVYAYDSVAIGASIESAQAAGIPIILYDRAADASVTQPDLFIGLDTVAQAYDAGVYFFGKMQEAGVEPVKIISIIGSLADQNALNRIEGFDKAAAEFGWKVEVTVPSEWDSDVALANFSSAWLANPDSNCVLIASDFIITSVQSVLEANGAWIPAGEEGHVWICAQDGFPIGLQYVRDGYIDVEGVYNLNGMADLFVGSFWKLMAGEELSAEELYQTAGGGLMDKDNVDSEPWWSLAYE